MPIYEYQCEICGEIFDKLFASIRQVPAEITCPTCHSPNVRRLLSMPAIRRAGEGTVAEVEAGETGTPDRPAVFGRKELNEALQRKKQLAESDD